MEHPKIQVKVISTKERASIVEYVDELGTHRVIMDLKNLDTSSSAKPLYFDKEDLEEAIPYGVPWEDLITDKVITGEKLGQALRDNGVWTYSDVFDHPMQVLDAIHSAFGLTVESVLAIAKEHR